MLGSGASTVRTSGSLSTKNVNSGAIVLTVETADPYTTYAIEISSDLVVLTRLQMTIRCSAGEFRQKARRFFEILVYDFLKRIFS